ncbi:Protein kinase, putative [Hondaea fermentalgiana]|uniref:Protein kinase, putative n=1 Tax=Hondaea fermentalgiana TaxID=2315210 RepID=A0A2R5GTB4_9STRA|nr:Protein kinase, putative [Hondaea fermentalgiana]|eukprot:GBG33825.1 Protein kinase, putative [Hondaea fermentalgiana]
MQNDYTPTSGVELVTLLVDETKTALQGAVTCKRRAKYLLSILEQDIQPTLSRWQQAEKQEQQAQDAALHGTNPMTGNRYPDPDGQGSADGPEGTLLIIEAKMRDVVVILRQRFATPSCLEARALELFRAPLAAKALLEVEQSLKLASSLCLAALFGEDQLLRRHTIKGDRKARPIVDDEADRADARADLVEALKTIQQSGLGSNRGAFMEVSQWIQRDPKVDTTEMIEGLVGTKRQQKASALLAQTLISAQEHTAITLAEERVQLCEPEDILGQGHFAQVLAGVLLPATHHQNEESESVAVKRVRSTRAHNLQLDDREALVRESQLWKDLHHDNIVCLRGACITASGHFQLVLDRCDVSLHDLLYEKMADLRNPDESQDDTDLEETTRLDATDKEVILRGIARGLAFLHSKSIMCGDLQPANVLLNHDLGLVKLANFELVTRGADNASREPSYMAPEVLQAPAEWTTMADMYSFAIVVWELYYREPPYKESGTDDLATRVLHGERPELLEGVALRAWVTNIMERCWAHNPLERLSATEVLEKLEFRGSARQSTRMVRGLLTLFTNARIPRSRPSVTSVSKVRMIQLLLKELSEGPSDPVRTLQSLHDALWREWHAGKTEELRSEACSRGVVIDLKRIFDAHLSGQGPEEVVESKADDEKNYEDESSHDDSSDEDEDDNDEEENEVERSEKTSSIAGDVDENIFTSALWVLRYALSVQGAVALRETAVFSYAMGDRVLELLEAYPESPEMQAAGCSALAVLAFLSPRNADHLVHTLGAGKAVVRALLAHPNDIAVQENACVAVQRLAGTNESRVELNQALEAGIAVLDAMRRHSETETVVVQALGALSNLAVEERNQEILGQELGAGEEIRNAMRFHLAEASVQRSACGALQNLSANDRNQTILGQELNIGVEIVSAMRKHKKNPAVLRLACGAVRNLASNNIRNKEILCQDLNVGDDIVRAMSVFPIDEELQSEGCDALLNLAEDDLRNAQILGQDVHACEEILRAMLEHKENWLIQEKGCDAVLTLAIDDMNKEILGQRLKAGLVIAEAMRMHRDNPIVQENACGALQNLASRNSRNKEILCQKLNVGVQISLAMKAHADHAGVQEYACGALWNLAATNARNKEILCQEVGAGHEVVEAMRAHPKALGVQEQACGVLRTLAGNDRNKVILGQHLHAGADIIHAMRANISSASLQRNACGALQNLALDDENREAFIRDLGATSALLEAIRAHRNNASVQVNALGALRNLAAYSVPGDQEILTADEDVAHEVALVMSMHQDQPRVLELGCGVLRNLATGSERDRATLGKNEEIITEILEAMRSHPEHPGLQQAACAAVYAFACNSAARSKLRSLGAVEDVKTAKARFTGLKGPRQALRKLNAWF